MSCKDLEKENRELKKLIRSMYEHAVQQRINVQSVYEATELIEKQLDSLLDEYNAEKKRRSNIKRSPTRKIKHLIRKN